MKILFTISHFFDATGDQRYGSTGPHVAGRIEALSACLGAIGRLFAPSQQVEIVVCTTGGHHLLDRIAIGPDRYTHWPTAADPKLLGFECQAVLGQRRGEYDYYGFLEDDLILHDPQFFEKLALFTAQATPARLLLPNRYEAGHGIRCFIDRQLHPRLLAQLAPAIRARLPGGREPVLQVGPAQFCRAPNPHSGCYFLNAAQMDHWAGQPHFLDRDTGFVGPLESAATLGVLRTFEIYKPAPANLDFLVIQHFGTRYLEWHTRSFNV
jgi:hypothetical protein